MHTFLTMLASGEPVGTLAIDRDDDDVKVTYIIDNNGRGARLTEHLQLAQDGQPSSWRIEGTSLMGGAVDEAYERTDGVSRWVSQADQGESEVRGLYQPVDGSPYALTLIVDQALAAGGPVTLLPDGVANVTKVEFEFPPVPGLRLYRVTGVALHAVHVAYDESRNVLAIEDSGTALVAEELIPHFQAFADAIKASIRQQYAEIAGDATLHSRGTLVIKNVRVFDPQHGSISPGTIVVKDRRIEAVLGDRADLPDADSVIDAAGRLALPGLHDMHAHLETSSALLYLAAGVTTVRDLGNDNHALDLLQQSIAEGTLIGPSTVRAGFIEGRSDFSARFGKIVSTLEEAIAAVDWYADRGYPAIKIYNSFVPDWVAPTAARAHARGMRVQGHIPAFMDADRAIADGYDEITHMNQLALGWVLEPEEDTRTPLRLTALARVADLDVGDPRVQYTAGVMAAKGISLDTTLSIIEQLMLSRARTVIAAHEPLIDHMPARWKRSRKRTYVPYSDAAELESYERAFSRLLEITKMLHDRGILLWPGTDDSTGVSVHRELELFVEAGLTNEDTLRLSTVACERHLHRDDRGLIASGQVADFILVDGDPTTDIHDIRNVALTVAEGRAVSPARIHKAFGIKPWAAEPAIARPKNLIDVGETFA